MFDQVITEFDKALRTVFASAPTARVRPGEKLEEGTLTAVERRHAAALMRVNHVGEVCAQALYQGQALTSRDPATRAALVHAAWEETEHLNWTESRIAELGGRKSLLNPLWYTGALAFGVIAGKFGDKWNLGFLAETERQVGAHLVDHLQQLPTSDVRSRAVLEQMASDEAEHAATAVRLGAAELPAPIKSAMAVSSKVMTTTAYYV
ncbi:MAG TPA: 2-polyprenyl-3-methyl-6-methoxy-1,4-benzoquinone monooxygenase [Rhodocyclaceae bacterium]|jgi:ubiquinone biosynthesis monooxygenase Coq7|nr:2-polyprenyl-3-methyl-6-methoxy-1,4-benzoquinone monooxygenase [Rhodocyclaceae bacterium]